MTAFEAFIMTWLLTSVCLMISLTYTRMSNRAWVLGQLIGIAAGSTFLFVPGMDNTFSQATFLVGMMAGALINQLAFNVDDRLHRILFLSASAIIAAGMLYPLSQQVFGDQELSWILLFFCCTIPVSLIYTRTKIMRGYIQFLRDVGADREAEALNAELSPNRNLYMSDGPLSNAEYVARRNLINKEGNL